MDTSALRVLAVWMDQEHRYCRAGRGGLLKLALVGLDEGLYAVAVARDFVLGMTVWSHVPLRVTSVVCSVPGGSIARARKALVRAFLQREERIQ